MVKEMGNDILSDQFRVLVTFYLLLGRLACIYDHTEADELSTYVCRTAVL